MEKVGVQEEEEEKEEEEEEEMKRVKDKIKLLQEHNETMGLKIIRLESGREE